MCDPIFILKIHTCNCMCMGSSWREREGGRERALLFIRCLGNESFIPQEFREEIKLVCY